MLSIKDELHSDLDVKIFNNICRVCLQLGNNSNSLLNEENLKKFHKITQIDINSNDDLPKNICDVCLNRLEMANMFIDECNTSQKVLKDIFLKKAIANNVNFDHNYSKLFESTENEIIIKEVSKKDVLPDLTTLENSDKPQNQKNWRCTICQCKFTTRGLLLIHKRTHTLFNCQQCSVTFKTLQSFKEHNQIHRKTECGQLVCKNSKKHKRNHSNKSPMICQYCGLGFKYNFTLNRHLKTHGVEIDQSKANYRSTQSRLCHICGKLVLLISFNQHITAHNGVKRIQVKCPQCDKLLTKQRLSSHLKSHLGIKPYRCDICVKSFTTNTAFKSHLFLHTGEKPFSCTCCGKKFPFKRYLNLHMKVHDSADYTFGCSICHKMFINKKQWEKHVEEHSKTKVKVRRVRTNQHRCFYCKNDFCSKKELSEHIIGDHLNNESIKTIKPYICEVCEKEFDSNGHLQAHFLVHTGEKSHKCNYCGKLFAVKGNLTAHVRLHEGISRFTCEYCNKGFYFRTKYNKHVSSCSRKQ